jgi:hypothetical protein
MAHPQAFCGWRFASGPRLVPSGPDVAAIPGPGSAMNEISRMSPPQARYPRNSSSMEPATGRS